MDEQELKEIEARCEAATDGPWKIWDGPAYAGGGKDWCIGSGDDWVANMDHRTVKGHSYNCEVDFCDVCSGITEEQKENAEFIAHARTDIPALIKAIRVRDKRIVELEEQVDTLRSDDSGLMY